ncbi:hypothetical protein M2189_004846 [Bradyrhizobium japonicum]|uniref:hypothetical protein n=1 Tax=Bradyrhizobium japonicum TaxID=375 RepID=UPI002168AEC7|nr:hypothetical protein [Bradyrhizobium japonicum]MCS3496194.1 hypothetical protein [Bradyrhizobium japonicum]MCS3961643.1 hypothetical protein [Bradyrhizobium japonicum]MCS3993959.1 hypothetical protein [Bradyrhizobium japonicum]
MPKPTPLSAAEINAIQGAKQFQTSILIGRGKYRSALHPSLAAAREAAPQIEAEVNNGRRCMVHAIDRATEKAILVPVGFDPAAPVAAKAEKPAKPKASAKPAKATKPKAGSKSNIAVKMLGRKGGAARKAIVEACGGWQVDLKQLCARRGLKLQRLADGNFIAS